MDLIADRGRRVQVADLNEALIDQSCVFSVRGCSTFSSLSDLSQLSSSQIEVVRRNPFVFDSLLLGLFLPEDNLHAPNESFKLSVMDKGIATSMRILAALAGGK